MKVVIPGGSGQVGTILASHFTQKGAEVVVLARWVFDAPWRVVEWDAVNGGSWENEIDGADVVINLAGRSVNCRYTAENRREIMDSRILSTKAIGNAIAKAANPPKVWLQSSTATIYSHRFDAPNDDVTGIIGGSEPDAPDAWKFSIDVATNWETAAKSFDLPATRLVLMRASVILSPDRGGIFDVMLNLVKKGLGGTAGSGKQFVSWVHYADFVRAVDWLIDHDELSGPINIASPNPLPNREFMKIFRDEWGIFGMPAMEWQIKLGAIFMRTEPELVLKSRRVVPTILQNSGFEFNFPDWSAAAKDLCRLSREIK